MLINPALGLVAPNRMATEDWAGARARVNASSTLAKWVQRQRNAVDGWATLNRENPELVGGWIHDYVDATTGVPVAWTEATPEPTDGSSEQATRFKQAWVAFMRQRNISYAVTAARLYRLTGDEVMGEWALRQIDFYATNYLQWPLRTYNGRGRMFRHGLDEAYNVFNLIDAARLLRDAAGAERIQRWNEQLFLPMAENLQTVTSPMTNVALWHAGASAAIAMQVGNAALLDHALNGTLGIRATNAQGITADHIWFEGSLGYNQYVIDALSKLLVHASLQGYAGMFAREWDDARRLLLAPLDYRFYNGSLPSPGDVTGSLMALDDRSHTLLYRVVPTWYGARAAARTTTWEALLDPPVTFDPSEPVLPQVASRNFTAIRMAVLRAGDWQAFVHYGQVASNHAQEEALTYELEHGSSRLTSDSGTVSYSSPYHKDYFRRAAAHNVPMVDGMGQQRWSPGVVTDFSSAQARLVVDHSTYRTGVAVTRAFRASLNGFAERSTITVKDGTIAPRRLGSAFHTDCQVSPGNGLTPAATPRPVPDTEGTAYWRMDSQFDAPSTWTVRLNCGGQDYELRVSAITGGKQRVYIGQAPTRPLPALRGAVYYETEGTHAEFLAEIKTLEGQTTAALGP
jgi:hypothetical protein